MAKSKHNKYFELARRLSLKSDHYQYHLGCVLVKKSKVISVGWNMLKTHPKSPHKWNMIHAEFHAILGVPAADLRGSTIYIYRENKKGEPALAKPCKSCYKMLEDCDIKTVYHTINGSVTSYDYY